MNRADRLLALPVNFLNELLAKAGLKREEVFITNVVKCRPPGNRDPLPEELVRLP